MQLIGYGLEKFLEVLLSYIPWFQPGPFLECSEVGVETITYNGSDTNAIFGNEVEQGWYVVVVVDLFCEEEGGCLAHVLGCKFFTVEYVLAVCIKLLAQWAFTIVQLQTL